MGQGSGQKMYLGQEVMKEYDGSQSLGHLTLQGCWSPVESLYLNTAVPQT